MSEPVASIVIPTRDRPRFVHRAVASALGQTLRDIEVIVVDNGEELPFRAGAQDDRLRILRHHGPKSATAARNLGMANARGEWITFLDDDDVLYPEMVEISLRAASESSLPLPVTVLSGMEVVDLAGKAIEIRLPVTLLRGRHYFLEEKVGGGNFQAHAFFTRLEVFKSIGGWDEEIRASEHSEVFLRLNAVSSIQGLPVVTYRAIRHNDGHLSSDVLAMAEGMRRTHSKHRELFALHRRREAHYLAAMGIYFLKAGRWGDSLRATSRSLLRYPLRPRSLAYWAASLAGPRLLPLYRMRSSRLVRRRGRKPKLEGS
jgi:glycosyltransferase involved in cell wall biosynthesis